jgi:hypothetical protein
MSHLVASVGRGICDRVLKQVEIRLGALDVDVNQRIHVLQKEVG